MSSNSRTAKTSDEQPKRLPITRHLETCFEPILNSKTSETPQTGINRVASNQATDPTKRLQSFQSIQIEQRISINDNSKSTRVVSRKRLEESQQKVKGGCLPAIQWPSAFFSNLSLKLFLFLHFLSLKGPAKTGGFRPERAQSYSVGGTEEH